MKKRAWIVAGAAAAALAVPFGWWQNNGLTVSRYEYRSPKVGAALDGATVVQISDLHNHRFGEGQGRLLAAVAGLEPDLVVVTGDMVDCHRTDPAPALELVRGLVALAPVYYVTGNHEWVLSSQVRGELLTGLEEAGATVLEDRVTRVALGEGYLTPGRADPVAGPRAPASGTVRRHRGGSGVLRPRPRGTGASAPGGRAVRPRAGSPAGADRGGPHRLWDHSGGLPGAGQQHLPPAAVQPAGGGGRHLKIP